MSVKLNSDSNNSNKTLSIKREINVKPKKNKNNIYKEIISNSNLSSKNKHYFIDSIINSPKNKQLQIFNRGIKNQLIMEELNKK